MTHCLQSECYSTTLTDVHRNFIHSIYCVCSVFAVYRPTFVAICQVGFYTNIIMDMEMHMEVALSN